MIKVINRSSKVLKEIVIDYEPEAQDSKADEYADMIGKYPFLMIGNLNIQTTDTIIITLYNNQFLPRIEIQFKDPTYKLIDPLFPTDDDIISIFIRSSSEMLMPVRMDFKILETNVVKGEGNNQELTFTVTGILDVNSLYYTPIKSYPNTSYQLLKKLASEFELGFASNINDTNDAMIWINPGETNLEFIQDVVNYSYISDKSFMYAYVDFYYNLNYVDMETALNEDITEQTGIFFSANIIKNQSEEPTMDLFLTDHQDKTLSNQFINKYNLTNSSTKVNLDIGYKSVISYYDKNNSIFYKLMFDTISTPGPKGENLILKGKVGEISELVEQSVDIINLGKIDTDNVHDNYPYARQQNLKNMASLQKVKIKVTLTMMNFNLYRFQKIELKFYKLSEISEEEVIEVVDESSINKRVGKDFDEKKLNKRLSGEWLITAINYTFNMVNGFSQEVILVKRELGFNDNDFDK